MARDAEMWDAQPPVPRGAAAPGIPGHGARPGRQRPEKTAPPTPDPRDRGSAAPAL